MFFNSLAPLDSAQAEVTERHQPEEDENEEWGEAAEVARSWRDGSPEHGDGERAEGAPGEGTHGEGTHGHAEEEERYEVEDEVDPTAAEGEGHHSAHEEEEEVEDERSDERSEDNKGKGGKSSNKGKQKGKFKGKGKGGKAGRGKGKNKGKRPGTNTNKDTRGAGQSNASSSNPHDLDMIRRLLCFHLAHATSTIQQVTVNVFKR